MKRLLLLIFLVSTFLVSSSAWAQFTSVSGTVTDPNGIPYSYGTIASVIVSTNTPKFTSTSQPYIQPTQATGLDVNGKFLVRLADNTALTPGSSTWTFTVCSGVGTVQPALGLGPVCFTVTGVTISGSSQNISTTLNNAAKALTLSGTGIGAQFLTNGNPNQSQQSFNATDGTAGGVGSHILFVHPNNDTGGFVSFNLIPDGSSPGQMFYVNGALNLTEMTGATWNDGTGIMKLPGFQSTAGIFTSIGTCNSGAEGTMRAVTDSTTATWGATITGSGTNHVLAYCDGTNWTVAGK